MEVIAKSNNDNKYDLDYILKKFKNCNDLEKLKGYIKKASDRVFIGWGSVDCIDEDGEKIMIDEVIKTTENWIKNRDGVLLDSHKGVVVGKALDFKVMKNKNSNTQGVLYLAKIHDGLKSDDIVWKNIISGEYKGMSVGGIKEKTEYNGNERILRGFKQFETSLCNAPANPYALMESFSVVAKNLKKKNKINFSIKSKFYVVDKYDKLIKSTIPPNAVHMGRNYKLKPGEKSFTGPRGGLYVILNEKNPENVIKHPMSQYIFRYRQLKDKIKGNKELDEDEKKILSGLKEMFKKSKTENKITVYHETRKEVFNRILKDGEYKFYVPLFVSLKNDKKFGEYTIIFELKKGTHFLEYGDLKTNNSMSKDWGLLNNEDKYKVLKVDKENKKIIVSNDDTD